MASNTISLFIPEVLDAIVAEYGDLVATPDSPDGWRAVAGGFSSRWNFHHCLGAVGGKHIRIVKPNNTGSLYHNYKGFFSVVLFAIVGPDHRFMYVDIGGNGSTSDCSIYDASPLKVDLASDDIGLPVPHCLPRDDAHLPYFLIGDDAFPLATYMMKPFSQRNMDKHQRIFNYRLSRARRIVENAFGILANRFRCLLCHRRSALSRRLFRHASACITSCVRAIRCCRTWKMDMEHVEPNVIPWSWRTDAILRSFRRQRGLNASTDAKKLSLYLCEYYNAPNGAVSWQDRMI